MHIIIWSYTVKPDYLTSFLDYYSPEGKWADLFRKSGDYLTTELLRSDSDPLQFITIDRWESKQAYTQFLDHNKEAYRTLDKITEAWTAKEERIGRYTV